MMFPLRRDDTVAPAPHARCASLGRAAAAALAGGLLLAGCDDGRQADNGTSAMATDTVEEAAPMTVADLDERYIIGPTASRSLDYRIVWQSEVDPSDDAIFAAFGLAGDAVFVRDTRNDMTRLRAEDGTLVWQGPISGPYDQMRGIHRAIVDGRDTIYLTTDHAVLLVDAASGGVIGRQDLGYIATTEPVVSGPYLIYGGSNGRVVWHQYVVGYQAGANTLSGTLRNPPVLYDDLLAIASVSGHVMVLDRKSTRALWHKRLLDQVTTSPAAGNGALFVAGRDQYLWAFDLGNGKVIWRYLANAPLVSSPTVLGSDVYQAIPGTGLVCFEAVPRDEFGGVKRWTAEGVDGEVIGRHRSTLMVWDASQRVLSLVDRDRGFVIEQIDLPQVTQLTITDPNGGDLFAASDDGRITRLAPR